MSKQEVILCEGLANSLTHTIEKCPHDKLFILTDEHTHRLCRPHLDGIPALEEAEEIIDTNRSTQIRLSAGIHLSFSLVARLSRTE